VVTLTAHLDTLGGQDTEILLIRHVMHVIAIVAQKFTIVYNYSTELDIFIFSA
jgi:hypothetical protein